MNDMNICAIDLSHSPSDSAPDLTPVPLTDPQQTGWIGRVLLEMARGTTVRTLLLAEHPPISSVAAEKPEDCFSPKEPDTLPGEVPDFHDLPTPSSTFLARLLGVWEAQWRGGALSVRWDQKHYPLTILLYWDLVYEIRHSQEQWQRVIDWLGGLMDDPSVELPLFSLATQVYSTVQDLPWRGKLLVNENMSHMVEAASLLGREWLTDLNIDQMLSVLAHDLAITTPLSHALPRMLGAQIVALHGTKRYPTSKGYARLREFGNMLVDERVTRFGTVFHVNGNHWVALAVDTKSKEIHYGDSLRGDSEVLPNRTPVAAVLWWLEQHGMDGFVTKAMPIMQQPDGWSCGIRSFNALASYLHPETYVLLGSIPGDRDIVSFAQLGQFDRIIARSVAIAEERKSEIVFLAEPSPDTCIPFVVRQQARNEAVVLAVGSLTKGAKGKKKQQKPKTNTISTTSTASGIEAVIPLKFKSSSAPEKGAGRPRDDLLDDLTKAIGTTTTSKGHTVIRYQCVACSASWSGRTRPRILSHAAVCSRLPSELRGRASAACAQAAPMAQVEAAAAARKRKRGDNAPELDTANLRPAQEGPFASFHQQGKKEWTDMYHTCLVEFICVLGLSPSIVDSDVYKRLVNVLSSGRADVVSSTRLADTYIPATRSHINAAQIAYLRTQTNLTVSFDGGSTRRKDGLYTVHVMDNKGWPYVQGLINGRGESHTAKWVASHVKQVIAPIGLDRFGGSVSDNAGNTRGAREILEDEIPTMIPSRDPAHLFSLYVGELCKLSYFRETIIVMSKMLEHFSHSLTSTDALDTLRKRDGISRGLEHVVKTRFASIIWAAKSVQRCLAPIRELVSSGKVDLDEHNVYFEEKSAVSLTFELVLNQLVAVGEPAARSIQCLEARQATLGDVPLYFGATGAMTWDVLTSRSLAIPSTVASQVNTLFNKRCNEMLGDDKKPTHVAALFLNPRFRESDIWAQPNQMKGPAVTIPSTLGPSSATQVPPGIKNTKAYLKIANFLADVAANEIHYGCNPEFTIWKQRGSKLFAETFKEELKAYARKAWPFNVGIAEDETVHEWWEKFRGTDNGGLLAAVANKLNVLTPHSMNDERTMSAITWINSPRRNRQRVETLFSHVQIRQFKLNRDPDSRTSKRIHSGTTLRFYDVKKWLPKEVDDEESDSEDEHGVSIEDLPVDDPEGSSVLALEEETSELNVRSEDLRDILAEDPPKRSSARVEAISQGELAAADSEVVEGTVDGIESYVVSDWS